MRERQHLCRGLWLGLIYALLVSHAEAQEQPLNADTLQAGKRWIYTYEQMASGDTADESIYRRYPVQWIAQTPVPGLNPDEWTISMKERGGPDETRERIVSYGLWPSCFQGPDPTLPQACATGESQTWTLDGKTYPIQIYANDRQAIFYNPTLGIVEDAFLDARQVLVTRKLIGFDFGSKNKGGDTSSPTICDWEAFARVKQGTSTKLKLDGKHKISNEVLVLCSSDEQDCTVSLTPSLQWSTAPFVASFVKAWPVPDNQAHEFIVIQGESPEQFSTIILHLSPDGVEATQHLFAKPSPSAKFSALLMQQDRMCHLQTRLKQDQVVQVANFALSPGGVQRLNGSLAASRQRPKSK